MWEVGLTKSTSQRPAISPSRKNLTEWLLIGKLVHKGVLMRKELNPAALITGAAKRIGRSIALALARRGYDVAVHCNRSREEAEKLHDDLEELGVRCEILVCDLRSPDMDGLVESAVQLLPGLQLLVNNASVFEKASLSETDREIFDLHFDVNLKAPFFLSKHFAESVRRGHIVNIVDARIFGLSPEYTAYALTKGALFDLTRLNALELAPDIRVNAIAPGAILPPPGKAPDYLKPLTQRIPLRQHGSPENIAQALLYLLDNEFVTGQCLTVDGGEWLWR